MLFILLSAWYNILMCAEACEQSTATNLPTSQTDLLPSTLYVSPSKVSAFTWWELVYMALVRGSRVCEYFSIEEGQNKHILLLCHLIRYNLFHERQRARHCTMLTHGLHKGRSPPRLQKKTWNARVASFSFSWNSSISMHWKFDSLMNVTHQNDFVCCLYLFSIFWSSSIALGEPGLLGANTRSHPSN